MRALPLWRWVLVRLVKNPIASLLCCILIAVLPLAWSLRPIATEEALPALALRWAFPAGLLGAAMAMAPLSQGQAFLARLAPGTRWAGELGALALAPIYLQLPIFAGLFLCGAAPSDLGRALPAILTCDLHLAGLAQLLFLLPLSTSSRVTVLLAGVWVVPAVVAPHAALDRVLAPLDAGLALRTAGPAQLLPALSLAVSLVLVGFLLRTSASRPGSA